MMWSLTVSLVTRSRTDLAQKQWIFIFIHIFFFSFECSLSLSAAT
jgi:hypothetical protein